MASYAGPVEYFWDKGDFSPLRVLADTLTLYQSGVRRADYPHLIWKCSAGPARGDNISLATFDDRTQNIWNTL